jgi:hypothetical protein
MTRIRRLAATVFFFTVLLLVNATPQALIDCNARPGSSCSGPSSTYIESYCNITPVNGNPTNCASSPW